ARARLDAIKINPDACAIANRHHVVPRIHRECIIHVQRPSARSPALDGCARDKAKLHAVILPEKADTAARRGGRLDPTAYGKCAAATQETIVYRCETARPVEGRRQV